MVDYGDPGYVLGSGYDGKPLQVGNRIELHPATDLWMQGARYGEIVGCHLTENDRLVVQLDKIQSRKWSTRADNVRKI